MFLYTEGKGKVLLNLKNTRTILLEDKIAQNCAFTFDGKSLKFLKPRVAE